MSAAERAAIEEAKLAEERAKERREARFSRFITICVVTATLAAGVAGFLASAAARKGARASADAEALSVKANATIATRRRAAIQDFDSYVKAETERRRAANARFESLIAGGPSGAALATESSQWEAIAADTAKRTTITPDHPDGPGNDPFFPQRFLTEHGLESVRLSALQDAANEENQGWSKQATSYTAILTFFAVALYLFGACTSVAGRLRPLFVLVGLVLVAVGLGCMTINVAKEPHGAGA
jgi:hypothetical protein